MEQHNNIDLESETFENESYEDYEYFRNLSLKTFNFEEFTYRLTRMFNSWRVKFMNVFPEHWRPFIHNYGWYFPTCFFMILIIILYYIDYRLNFTY